MKPPLRKGVPSLFTDLKPLYKVPQPLLRSQCFPKDRSNINHVTQWGACLY